MFPSVVTSVRRLAVTYKVTLPVAEAKLLLVSLLGIVLETMMITRKHRVHEFHDVCEELFKVRVMSPDLPQAAGGTPALESV
jgi:hypothetical protein